MLLLYVDDLFVKGMDGLIVDTKKNLVAKFQNEGLGYDALFSRYGGVAKCRWNLPWIRKYAVEILKRFGMIDYKAMATPMASTLNLLSDSSSESVDAMMYRQMIGSLMYLTNM